MIGASTRNAGHRFRLKLTYCPPLRNEGVPKSDWLRFVGADKRVHWSRRKRMQSVAIGQIGRTCGDGVTRRILVIGTAAVIFTSLWPRTNMAQSARSELEEIVRLVVDLDGYIDAEIHARCLVAAGGRRDVPSFAASL